VIEGVGVTIVGTAPSVLFTQSACYTPDVNIVGSDLSGVTWTTLVSSPASSSGGQFKFVQCKMPASFVPYSSGTLPGNAEIFISDCASGDTHGYYFHANSQGSSVSDTGVYLTAGAAGRSWKITTTSAATFYNPYVTPWFGYYATGTSAIEPYLEFLRNNDGTISTYDNDEVWIEAVAKVSTGFTNGTLYSDRMALLGTPAAQASSALGAGDWTGETGTCAYGVIKSPSLTPAENGHIMARVAVGIEITGKLYVDPQIRT
jgi:hypothetical protein